MKKIRGAAGMKERLQKYIAKCGAASRRKAEELIFDGRVKVNGSVVNNVVIVDDEVDVVELDGKVIKPEENMVYIMVNKPTEIITSAKDQFDRKTVLDIVNVKERVYPVGRLDYDTSGLLILTNDGDVTNRMTHPSHEVNKVYAAEIIGVPTKEEMDSFEKGLKIEDYITSPARIRIIESKRDMALIEVTIHEGKNRQVRKMCEAIGHPVINLKRIAFGKLKLGKLKPGEWRNLSESEIEYLKSIH